MEPLIASKSATLVVFLSYIFFVWGGKTEIKDGKKMYVVKIEKAFSRKISDSDAVYCLVSLSEKDLKDLTGHKYGSQYDFYDTLRYKYKGRCILDYGVKYWNNSCAIGKFSYTKENMNDSAGKSALERLTNNGYFSFIFLDLKRPARSNLYVGISEVIIPDYCTVLSKINICILPEADSIIIIKKGFSLKKGK